MCRMCVCVCLFLHLCYISGTVPGINRTHSPHVDQRPVLMWQNVISEVLIQFRGKLGIEVRLR